MKRTLLAAAAILTLGVPAAASAQNYYDRDQYNRGYDPGYYGGDSSRYGYGPYGYGRGYYHSEHRHYWRAGEHLPRDARQYEVRDWWRYGVGGPSDQNNAWYRVGDQLVMANIWNGLIATTAPLS